MADTFAVPVFPTLPEDIFQPCHEESGPDSASLSARESMLEQMNREVLNRLQLTSDAPRILDMRCGLGATLRSIARAPSAPNQYSVSIVPRQLERTGALGVTDRLPGNF